MVLTNYECWSNVAENTASAITLQQIHLRSRTDHFNPRTLGVCGIIQMPHDKSCEISTKNVSQISSNGYYGFTYVNNIGDDVAGNGNDVNTNFGNFEDVKKGQHIYNDSLKFKNKNIELDHTLFTQSKKRTIGLDEFPGSWTNTKKCRLEIEHEITNSLPLMEPESNMDVDDVEHNNEAKSPSINTRNSQRNIDISRCAIYT